MALTSNNTLRYLEAKATKAESEENILNNLCANPLQTRSLAVMAQLCSTPPVPFEWKKVMKGDSCAGDSLALYCSDILFQAAN